MFAGGRALAPSLRGTALVSAMLVGAYGTDAGLAATALLLMAYAAAAGLPDRRGVPWRWVGARAPARGDVGPFALDDGKMKTFQRATLQIFDMPHHPRRLRQAVGRSARVRGAQRRAADAQLRLDGEARAARRRRRRRRARAGAPPWRFGTRRARYTGRPSGRGTSVRARHTPRATTREDLRFTHEGRAVHGRPGVLPTRRTRGPRGGAGGGEGAGRRATCAARSRPRRSRSSPPSTCARCTSPPARRLPWARPGRRVAVRVSGPSPSALAREPPRRALVGAAADEAEAFSQLRGGHEHAHVGVRAAGVGRGDGKAGTRIASSRAASSEAAGGAEGEPEPVRGRPARQRRRGGCRCGEQVAAEAANELANAAALGAFGPDDRTSDEAVGGEDGEDAGSRRPARRRGNRGNRARTRARTTCSRSRLSLVVRHHPESSFRGVTNAMLCAVRRGPCRRPGRRRVVAVQAAAARRRRKSQDRERASAPGQARVRGRASDCARRTLPPPQGATNAASPRRRRAPRPSPGRRRELERALSPHLVCARDR